MLGRVLLARMACTRRRKCCGRRARLRGCGGFCGFEQLHTSPGRLSRFKMANLSATCDVTGKLLETKTVS